MYALDMSDRPRHAAGVSGRLVDGEAVLVHPGQGKFRVLNRVGARIWALADGERTVADLAATIAAEYNVDHARAESDTKQFCGELVERGLLILD